MLKPLLHRIVLSTRRWEPAAAAYRQIYSLACRRAARAYRGAGAESVLLHRGLTRPGWEPGVSDIDLILLGEFDAASLFAVAKARRSLLRRWPMLGDLWVGSREEADRYLRWGGLRAVEDRPFWRALAGPEPPTPPNAESPLKRERLDPWVWALVSFMEVSRRAWSGAPLSAKDEADCRKWASDACRFSRAAVDGVPPAPRKPAAKPARELWLESALLLAQSSRTTAEKCLEINSLTEPFPAAATEESRRLEALRLSAGARAVVAMPPYHLFVIVDEQAGPEEFLRAAEASAGAGFGVPLVLTPSAWNLASQSSYLGAALGRHSSEEAAQGAGESHAFSAWTARGTGEALPQALMPRALEWECAAEAASWMALWWRALWIEPSFPNRFVLFHLYTRAFYLEAALEGRRGVPVWDWQGLLDGMRAARPEESGFLESLERFARQEPAACLDDMPRSTLDPAHFSALARAMARLGRLTDRGPCGR